MKKIRKTSAILLAFIMLLTAAFVGCGKKTETGKTDETKKVESAKIDAIKKAGKLVLGTSADYAPYEFVLIKDGKSEIVGFDIEIAKEIAKDLGVTLEIKNMDFKGLLPALKTGQVDMVISGMTPTDERKKEVDFSKIYYRAVQSVVVRAADKDKYKTVDSLTGKRVGAQSTSIQEGIAKEQVKDAKVTSLAKIPELVMSLKTNKVDAIIMEYPVAKGHVDKNADLAISDIKVGEEDGGSAIGVQKGQQDLVAAIDKTIDRLLSEGKIDKFVIDATSLIQ
ncbi:arginine-binding extracellular protein ArtP precursor [Clostridium homopropionicum DSM 5847]|uniref:Arginine-binding extracellular protein ArtP n=1 Tax=Clostridium homopropionicum DSM 5847 TaxID=1121318 RepID=A0A0L6Z7V2_9CLOT|nr:ABC transporter substrate-binding protein [Clostridium homopropionicum]KOA19047.1 arginine-binding extracellular protein ArtP precursor [Clostridium homopropionicum DSM 5847]SFG91599.1 amino acid ABC transporter substrate-binding protein, PAAT family [Clostridium homopropionicum]